jgi:hypothetical protein
MRRRARPRRCLKRGGLELSLLLAILWATSLLLRFSYSYEDGFRSDGLRYCDLELREGVLATHHSSWGQRSGGWSVEWSPAWPRWMIGRMLSWTYGVTPSREEVSVVLPIWMPFLLVALPTVLMFLRDYRRIPPGYCQKCRYNLTGNTSGTCPEYGTAVPKAGMED